MLKLVEQKNLKLMFWKYFSMWQMSLIKKNHKEIYVLVNLE